MTLADRIAGDLSKAMKERDTSVVLTLRMIRAAVKNTEIDQQRALTDEEVVMVIRTMTRQLKDALEQFRAGARADLVAKAENELSVLGAYLPATLSLEAVTATVSRVIVALGASGPKDFGKVMSAVIAEVQGGAEGSRVSAIVREQLQK